MKAKVNNRVTKEFHTLISRNTDNLDSIYNFIEFFNKCLRLKGEGEYIPFKEMMAIIKVDFPTTFYLMKKRSKNNTFLEMLTYLEMDYSKAKEFLYN
jgi:hypothetical protein